MAAVVIVANPPSSQDDYGSLHRLQNTCLLLDRDDFAKLASKLEDIALANGRDETLNKLPAIALPAHKSDEAGEATSIEHLIDETTNAWIIIESQNRLAKNGQKGCGN